MDMLLLSYRANIKNRRCFLYVIKDLQWHVPRGLNANCKKDGILKMYDAWLLRNLNIVEALQWKRYFDIFSSFCILSFKYIYL